MRKKDTKSDKFAQRESQNYDRPIASREFIMETLADIGKPLTIKQVAKSLGISQEPDLTALSRRLRAMERDGQLIRNRRNGYGLLDKMELVRGYVIAHADGFGFLVPDDASGDLFLSARQMRQLIHGDRVVARVSGIDKKGRREGRVVEVLERNTSRIVGRFVVDVGVGFVTPDNKRITHDIVVPKEHQGNALDGQIVVVDLIEQPDIRRQPIGKITEILGEHMAPGMEIDVAIRVHELPHVWPDAVENHIQHLPNSVQISTGDKRKDIRDLPLVTIDGKDARDFDDAVYCRQDGAYWRLIVAIADVAHYVTPNSPLDKEAQERGNSVYFPGRVIPMLPEVLSNGLCSINPDEDRLCLCCEMVITRSGKVKSYEFYNGIMRSHARLIYDDVAALLEGDKALNTRYQSLVPHLENLHSLYTLMLGQRKKRGAIDFETVESVIEFGEHKKIENIVQLIRNDAHKMIEEFMIAANVCAAEFLAEHDIHALYRIHDLPSADKLADLMHFLKESGLSLNCKGVPQAKHYAALLSSVRDRPDFRLIQTVMLRSLNQAVYSPNNVGHFGLALDMYAHFTSPIRRYPDLIVHRAIKRIVSKKGAWYNEDEVVLIGERCSMTERRADDATRDVADWLKCEYMLDKVGENFPGIISGVTGFGVFVELNDVYVEGLVHVTSLQGDYYHFDPVKHCLIGKRTNVQYCLGDAVVIQVARVDLDNKKIDFELIEQESKAGKSRQARKSKKKTATFTKKRSSSSAKKKKLGKKAKSKKKASTAEKTKVKKSKSKIKKKKPKKQSK